MNISKINSVEKIDEWCRNCFKHSDFNECELNDYCETILAKLNVPYSEKQKLKLNKIVVLTRKEKLSKLLSHP